MKGAIKAAVLLFVSLKLLEISTLYYLRRMTIKRERYIREQWLKRYNKTMPDLLRLFEFQ